MKIRTPEQHFVLHYGDLSNSSNLARLMQEVKPDEVYNLAAQNHVQVSFESPEYTADVDTLEIVVNRQIRTHVERQSAFFVLPFGF